MNEEENIRKSQIELFLIGLVTGMFLMFAIITLHYFIGLNKGRELARFELADRMTMAENTISGIIEKLELEFPQ